MKPPIRLLLSGLMTLLCGCLALDSHDGLWPCETDSDCSGSKLCLKGKDGLYCRHAVACSTREDCYFGQRCEDGQCTPPSCSLQNSSGCGNFSCDYEHSVCHTACSSNRGCKDGFACFDGQCLACSPDESGPCGPCGDSDADGQCDPFDDCPYGPNLDSDSDGICDSDDLHPNSVANDSGGDSVCNEVDRCPGFADMRDRDSDRLPDGCDECPAGSDSDGDGSCDSVDICPGFSDSQDSDHDGKPNGCDPCPQDKPDDTDSDGICDSADVCPFGPNNLDSDSDGIPNNCDPCPVADNTGDQNGDGLPDVCEVVLSEARGEVISESGFNPSGINTTGAFTLTYGFGYLPGDNIPAACSDLAIFGRNWATGAPGTRTFTAKADPSLMQFISCMTDGIAEGMGMAVFRGNTYVDGYEAPESWMFVANLDQQGRHPTYVRLIVDDIYVYRRPPATDWRIQTDYRWQVLGYRP